MTQREKDQLIAKSTFAKMFFSFYDKKSNWIKVNPRKDKTYWIVKLLCK